MAELSFRDLVPAIWLATPELRAERVRSWWRRHLVKHRAILKNRVHASLIAYGHEVPMADLFGARRPAAAREPGVSRAVAGSCAGEPGADRRSRSPDHGEQRSGCGAPAADHRYLPLPLTCPGIGWITGYTIAAEIGDINRFSSPVKLTGYSGLCPRVSQSGEIDCRGPLSKHGPKYLRWGVMEAAIAASSHPLFKERYQRTRRRLGRQRGPKIAQIELARKLSEAIWYMLTRNQPFKPFVPAGAVFTLTA